MVIQNGIRIPVLQNSVALEPYTKLVQYVSAGEAPEEVMKADVPNAPESEAKRRKQDM